MSGAQDVDSGHPKLHVPLWKQYHRVHVATDQKLAMNPGTFSNAQVGTSGGWVSISRDSYLMAFSAFGL